MVQSVPIGDIFNQYIYIHIALNSSALTTVTREYSNSSLTLY